MWTGPEARVQGNGGILDALLAWCRSQDGSDASCAGVKLHVTERNAGARGLYISRGFTPNGRWEVVRNGSSLQTEELQLSLR